MKPWTLMAVVGLGAFIGACGAEVPAAPHGNNLGGGTTCTYGVPTACTCQPGAVAGQQCDAAGNAFQCSCSTGLNPGGVTHPVPCEVSAVLETACWTCHGTTRQYTAPMSLVTYEDFQAPAPSNPALKVYQVIGGRIHHATAPMPPVPNPRLDATQLATMDSWLGGGAVAGTQATCGTTIDPVGGSGGAGGVSGVGGAGGTGGTGGTGLPEDVTCYDFLAHAPGSEAGYSVASGTTDSYMNFTFNSKWGAGAQAVSFKSKIDNTNVIHHWLLYQNTGSVAEGGVESGSGTHGGDELVAGWAPGGTDTILPPDVGMKLGTGFTMEIHYNNSGATQTDNSGVEICVTNTPRAKLAALHWLGTEAIFLGGAGSVAGNCSPQTNVGPITILTSWPHMHLKGTHMKTEITRAGGGKEMLIDQPFSFQNQIGYDTPNVIMPGDKLTTTCTYNSGATFGPGTGAEMCYNFVLAYPAGALTSTSAFGGGLTSTVNHCFQ